MNFEALFLRIFIEHFFISTDAIQVVVFRNHGNVMVKWIARPVKMKSIVQLENALILTIFGEIHTYSVIKSLRIKFDENNTSFISIKIIDAIMENAFPNGGDGMIKLLGFLSNVSHTNYKFIL